jgi:chondroitin AC lyase
MNYKNLFLLVIFLAGLSCSQSKIPVILEHTQNYPEELRQLHKNVLTYFLDVEVDSEEFKDFYSTLQKDGSWPDIDYPSKTRGYWSPRYHLVRMNVLAQVYQTPGTEYYQNKELSGKIHTALNYWLDNDFQSPNWWHPVIGTPMRLLPTLLLMEPELSNEQIAKALPILNRCEIGKTGQNKVWQSGNVLFTSLLTKNAEMIEKASASIKEELVVSTNEGVQPDWSYHQHGPQLQFGNYGLSYVGDMIKWISILRQTPFAFNESKVEILRNYLLQGQQWVIWKNQMDISACGRQLFLDSPADKATNLIRSFEKMAILDPEFSEDYKKAENTTILEGNKHFWRSDFHVKRTPEFYISVKMNSERVIGAESCNAENLQGYYMGDGATFIYQTGEEYRNIFPFLDW